MAQRAEGLGTKKLIRFCQTREAIVANAIGMKVSALSCITNMAAGIAGQRLCHEEVMEATAAAAPRMGRLLMSVLSA